MAITDKDARVTSSASYNTDLPNNLNGLTLYSPLTFANPASSLSVASYVNSDGDYVVAFAGTGGLQDAYQDIKLGWEQWRDARQRIIAELTRVAGEEPDAQIQFTGHSLGGMLAQYAAYDAIDLLSERLARPSSEIASQLEVTTFNAPGGSDGLEAYLPDEDRVYDPTLTGGLDATHYTVEGDLVSRLGGGHRGGATRRLSAHGVATLDALTGDAERFGAASSGYLATKRGGQSSAAFLGRFDLRGGSALGDRGERARPCGFAATPTIASHSSQLKSSVGH